VRNDITESLTATKSGKTPPKECTYLTNDWFGTIKLDDYSHTKETQTITSQRLFVTRMKCTRGQETRFRTKIRQYFGTNKGLLHREIRRVENLGVSTISLTLRPISLFLSLEKCHETCCIAKAKQQKSDSGHSVEPRPTELYLCKINFTLSINGVIVIVVL
jgi:hypothetical protein